MAGIQLNNSIGYADHLKIIFGEKCIHKILRSDRCLNITFQEVLHTAKENGFREGVILLIAENPFSGKIYRYGNDGACWEEHGTTRGYV
ncbi:hypothetical protein [uncultured Robinsoniella sp.]|uniref:hypothetical protein n=1 Tax=uncultured Robinsoniella sp. TaxID=904190 RepID=UPI00374E25CF